MECKNCGSPVTGSECEVCGAPVSGGLPEGYTISDNELREMQAQQTTREREKREMQDQSIVCPECSAQNLPDAIFCLNCGADLGSAEIVPTQEAIAERVVSPVAEPLALSASAVKVWTPRVVGVSSFLLGFPGGLLLASINRWRLGFAREARTLLLLGIAGLVVWNLTVLLIPGEAWQCLSGLINVGLAYLLYRLTKADILKYEAANPEVQNRGWLLAVAIGLGAILLYWATSVAIGALLALAGVQIAY